MTKHEDKYQKEKEIHIKMKYKQNYLADENHPTHKLVENQFMNVQRSGGSYQR